jgi:pilus assembly protein Flp/PilA
MPDDRSLREQDDCGATATEYGLLVGFIALIIVAGVTVLGGSLDSYFSGLGGWLATVI